MTQKEIIKLREDTRKLFQNKFGNIVFEEIPHRYTIDGVEYTPVSNIIHQYVNEFDVELQSAAYAEKNGLNQDDVKRSWKYKNKCATIMGTRAHEFGESYTNMLCGHPELICEQNKPQYLEEENWLIPTFNQEFGIKKFYDELTPSLIPIGAEFKLSTQYIKGAKPICGTADLLFYFDDPKGKNSGFVIGDWKSNQSLINNYIETKNITMKSPFATFFDEPIYHYSIQMNLYRKMMESIGLNIIACRLIWLNRNGDYEIKKIDFIDDKIINNVILNND